MAEYNQVPKLQPSSNPVHVGGTADTLQPITIPHAQMLVGSEERHKCMCGTKYTRLDALKRHIRQHTEAPAHPCTLCTQYQGPKAFHRADHLAQHMHHKHRPHKLAEAEPQEQALAHASRMPGLLDLPLLPFSCAEPGCLRSGQHGFLRQVDLDEHMMVHVSLQGSIPHQLGSADPNAFPMNNVFDQQGFNFQQDMNSQPVGGFFVHGEGINAAGEQVNGFQQYTNYGLAGEPLPYAGYGMDMTGGQMNDFQQYMDYDSAGDVTQYGGFPMDGAEGYANEPHAEFGPFF